MDVKANVDVMYPVTLQGVGDQQAPVGKFHPPTMDNGFFQPLVTVVSSLSKSSMVSLDVERPCPPGDTERSPNFRLIGAIDHNCVVRCGSPLLGALRPRFVCGSPRVYKDTPTAVRDLKRERIRVGVTWLVIRTNWRCIKEHYRIIVLKPDVPALSQPCCVLLNPKPSGILA
jgi:hypothetical protein